MEFYVFLMCLTVFILLTAGLSVLLYFLYKAYVLNIKNGSYDKEIIEEYKEQHKLTKNSAISNIVSTILIVIAMGLALFFTVSSTKPVRNVSMPKVVLSGSMSYKFEGNEYLFEHELNDQITTSDLIIVDKLPETLELYDIVVYKNKDNQNIIHRIVDIVLDKDGQTCYVTQGDANPTHDKYPVYREQMLGVYNGHKVKHIGHFIRFLQSYAGMLCLGLAVFVNFAYPFIDNKLTKIKHKRVNCISSVKWRVRHEQKK